MLLGTGNDFFAPLKSVINRTLSSSRTIPLRPEDYQRFHPELWVRRGHVPGRPVEFSDPALLQAELELRRRRREGAAAAARRRGGRAEEDAEEEEDDVGMVGPESFASLPWEEIVFNSATSAGGRDGNLV